MNLETRRNALKRLGVAIGTLGISSKTESVFAKNKDTETQVESPLVSTQDVKNRLLSEVPDPPNEHVVMQAITVVCYKVDANGSENSGITLADCQFFPHEAEIFPIELGKIPNVIPGSE